MQYLYSERLASTSEVDAPTRVDANTSIQVARSDGLRPGVLVQFPPLSFASAIQRFLDNEQAKCSKNLDNLNKALQAQIAGQLNGLPSLFSTGADNNNRVAILGRVVT